MKITVLKEIMILNVVYAKGNVVNAPDDIAKRLIAEGAAVAYAEPAPKPVDPPKPVEQPKPVDPPKEPVKSEKK
jgi:hypothetical protein